MKKENNQKSKLIIAIKDLRERIQELEHTNDDGKDLGKFLWKYSDQLEELALAQTNKLETEISERKLAEEKLNESEERFKNLVNNIPGAVYRCANCYHSTMEFISDNIDKISGYPSSDFINKNVRSYATIIHPEDRDDVQRIIQESIDKKQPYVLEYRIIDKDRKIKWVYDKGQGIFNNDGKFLWLDGVIFDITDHKIAEEQISRSEIKYRELANLLPQMVFEIDLVGKFTFLNNSAFEYTGYTQIDINNGLNALHLFLPEDRKRVMDDIQKIIKGEEVENNEFVLVKKDGSTFPVLIYSNPIVQGKKVVGLRGIAIDIIDKKRAEEKLKRSEEKYRQLFDSSFESITIVDINGNIFDCNKRTVEISGLPKEKIVGRPFTEIEFLDKEKSEEYKEIFSSLIRGEKVEPLEVRIRDQDNKERWLEVSPSVIGQNGNIYGIQIIARDTTAFKKVEN